MEFYSLIIIFSILSFFCLLFFCPHSYTHKVRRQFYLQAITIDNPPVRPLRSSGTHIMGFIKHQVSSTHNTHTPFLLSTAKARRTSCTEIHSFFPHRYVVLRCFAARRMTLMTGGARNWTSILYHILSPIVCVISVKEEEVGGEGERE